MTSDAEPIIETGRPDPGVPGARRACAGGGPSWRSTTSTCAIEAGEAVGYIGANGAGQVDHDQDADRHPGADPRRRRRTCGLRPGTATGGGSPAQVGVVFGQRSQLWWDLPVRESFRILAAIHGLSADRASRRAPTSSSSGSRWRSSSATPVRQLSLGQRMRAELAAALLHSPRLVILDEPTIGLDVLSKQRLREFLVAERATTAPPCC